MQRGPNDPGGQPSEPRRGHSFREGAALLGWLGVYCMASVAVVAGGVGLLSAGRWVLGAACLVAGLALTTVWSRPQAFKAIRQWQGPGPSPKPGE